MKPALAGLKGLTLNTESQKKQAEIHQPTAPRPSVKVVEVTKSQTSISSVKIVQVTRSETSNPTLTVVEVTKSGTPTAALKVVQIVGTGTSRPTEKIDFVKPVVPSATPKIEAVKPETGHTVVFAGAKHEKRAGMIAVLSPETVCGISGAFVGFAYNTLGGGLVG